MAVLDAVHRYRLDLAYDGTDFSGWARQPGRRTVQDTVENALATILRRPAVPLTVAGRTDAGVHAIGQVAHCDLTDAPPPQLLRRLAGRLPHDVRVHSVRAVPVAFDARFGALWRHYEYRITDATSGADPLRRRFVLSWPRSLDPTAMDAAARQLIGLHDFVAYCKHREGSSTIRDLQAMRVARDGSEIVCTVIADAFCHSMVRSLVGALLAVGEGRRPAGWPATLLRADRRANEVSVAAPYGLTLRAVGYPPDDLLAARAEQARARRGCGPTGE